MTKKTETPAAKFKQGDVIVLRGKEVTVDSWPADNTGFFTWSHGPYDPTTGDALNRGTDHANDPTLDLRLASVGAHTLTLENSSVDDIQ